MVNIDRLKNGFTRYVDAELTPKMNGWQKWVFSAGAAAYIANMETIVHKLKDNKAVEMLGIMDEECNVDIDKIYTHMRNTAVEPVTVSLPMIGSFTISRNDLDALYNYIIL